MHIDMILIEDRCLRSNQTHYLNATKPPKVQPYNSINGLSAWPSLSIDTRIKMQISAETSCTLTLKMFLKTNH